MVNTLYYCSDVEGDLLRQKEDGYFFKLSELVDAGVISSSYLQPKSRNVQPSQSWWKSFNFLVTPSIMTVKNAYVLEDITVWETFRDMGECFKVNAVGYSVPAILTPRQPPAGVTRLIILGDLTTNRAIPSILATYQVKSKVIGSYLELDNNLDEDDDITYQPLLSTEAASEVLDTDRGTVFNNNDRLKIMVGKDGKLRTSGFGEVNCTIIEWNSNKRDILIANALLHCLQRCNLIGGDLEWIP